MLKLNQVWDLKTLQWVHAIHSLSLFKRKEVLNSPDCGRDTGGSTGLGCIKMKGSSTDTSLENNKNLSVLQEIRSLHIHNIHFDDVHDSVVNHESVLWKSILYWIYEKTKNGGSLYQQQIQTGGVCNETLRDCL